MKDLNAGLGNLSKLLISFNLSWRDISRRLPLSGRSRGIERNVLFNTFYLLLYGVRHMVKDHSDSEKGNPLPPHGLLLSINSKGSFIWTISQTG